MSLEITELNIWEYYCFLILELIKTGGFGSVFRVKYKWQEMQQYVLKVISKLQIINMKQVRMALREREILAQMRSMGQFNEDNNGFIVQLLVAFHDDSNLYQVMQYYAHGDLRKYMINKIDCNQLQFIAANIICGLNYIHEHSIIHRDLKPENLMINDIGYIIVTDFGVASHEEQENANESSGTLWYMAPEVLFNQQHDRSVDYYALGIILYEIIVGLPPHSKTQNRQELRDAMLEGQCQINNEIVGFSDDCINFINALIKNKSMDRLTQSQIITHPWFKNIDWSKMLKQSTISPLQLQALPIKHMDEDIQLLDQLKTKCTSQLLLNNQIQRIFKDYHYNAYYLPLPK